MQTRLWCTRYASYNNELICGKISEIEWVDKVNTRSFLGVVTLTNYRIIFQLTNENKVSYAVLFVSTCQGKTLWDVPLVSVGGFEKIGGKSNGTYELCLSLKNLRTV